MPSEQGIAVTNGAGAKPKRGRPTNAELEERRQRALDLLSQEDDLYALIRAGNRRLTDDELEQFCGITPAAVYAMREIMEGRVDRGAMATIEAFCKMAEIGHRPAKGKARNADPDAGKTVIFNIAVAEIRPEIAAQQPKPVVIDVAPEPRQIEAPAVAIKVGVDA